jgi:NADH:ubiquinone oxidoreductase subunit E
MSDTELRGRLNKALRATVPALWEVVEVYPDTLTAIYMASPGEKYEWYRCKYTLTDDGADISNIEKVTPVTEFRPYGAEAPKGCKCHETPATELGATAPQGKGDDMATTVKELAGRLIACAKAPYEEADRPKLEAQTEAQLTALVKAFEPAPDPDPTPEPTPVPDPEDAKVKALAAAAKPKTAAEWMAEAPPEVRSLVSTYVAKDEKHRSQLIARLTAAQKKWGAAVLAKKATEELEDLCDMLSVEVPDDFSGRGLHAAVANVDTDRDHTPPDPWKVPEALARSLGLHKAS